MSDKKVYLTRVYRFSAAHRLWSPFLSEEENKKIYGKCGQSSGHGHNYTVKVTVKGSVDPLTGMLIDIAELDEIVDKHVIEPFDHKNLCVELKNIPVMTSESIIKEIWDRLQPHIKKVELSNIELHETRKNSFEYGGG